MKTTSLLEHIGNTPPPHPQNFLTAMDCSGRSWQNMRVSTQAEASKTGFALAMIDDGEKGVKIKKDTVIIEATSGNTGIGLALICAQGGIGWLLTMPESRALNAEICCRLWEQN